MSKSDPSAIEHVDGSICINPTDLSIDFPHGGTALGVTKARNYAPIHRYESNTAIEFGREPVEYWFMSFECLFTAIIRQQEKDWLELVHPNFDAATTTKTGETLIKHPGTQKSGTILSDRAFTMCFSPTDKKAHRFLIIHKAIPMIDEAAEFQLSIGEEAGTAIVIRGIRDRDNSNKVVEWGFREDITLP